MSHRAHTPPFPRLAPLSLSTAEMVTVLPAGQPKNHGSLLIPLSCYTASPFAVSVSATFEIYTEFNHFLALALFKIIFLLRYH